MKQIKSLLHLRVKQGYRYLSEIGFILILFALFVLTGIIFQGLARALSIPHWGSILLSFFTLIIIEVKRNDTDFLKSIFETKGHFTRYKFIENLLIVTPILIFQGFFLQWEMILAIIGVCGLTTLIPLHLLTSRHNETKSSIKLIPLSLFEIKFFIEKNKIKIAFLCLLLFLGSLHISLWVLGIVFFCVSPIEIFTPLEPVEMLNYQKDFILKKLAKNVLFFLIITLIPTFVTLLVLKVNVLIFIYGIFALILSITLAICKKYASYYGVNETVPTTNSTMILTFIMLLPGGILITISACLYYYFKSNNHLKKTYAIL